MSPMRLMIITIILVTVGQLTAGIYLPSLPHIARQLHTQAAWAQLLLVIYYLSYGVSQFLYGPLMDWLGRRLLTLMGLAIFMLGSVIGMLAPAIYLLWLGCFLQGLGIGMSGVLARAIPRDLFDGKALVAANSWMNAAIVIMPLLAPIIGGYLQEHGGWRANFVLLLIYSALVLLWVIKDFSETKQSSAKQSFSFSQAVYQYRQVLSNHQFQAYIICATIAFMSVPAFEVTGTFILQNVIGVSPVMFGWLSLIPFVGFVIGNFTAKRLVHVWSAQNLLLCGSWVMLLASALLIIPGWLHYVTIMAFLAPTTLFLLGAGMVIPIVITGAMEPFVSLAGTAGALLGGLQNIGGGLVTSVLSWLPEHTQTPLGVIFGIIAIIIVGVTRWSQHFNKVCE